MFNKNQLLKISENVKKEQQFINDVLEKLEQIKMLYPQFDYVEKLIEDLTEEMDLCSNIDFICERTILQMYDQTLNNESSLDSL